MSNNYTPTTWIGGKTIGTADVMNNIEKGVKDAHDRLDGVDEYKTSNDKNVKLLTQRSNKLSDTQKGYQYSFYSNIRMEVKDSPFVLGIVTDTHFNDAEFRPNNYNTLRELKMFNNICDNINITDKYNLGDIINGDYKNYILFNDVCEFKQHSKDTILIHGNHDCGSYIENLQILNPTSYGKRENSLLPPFDIYNLFYSDNDVTAIDKSTMAFYKDYEEQKIRVVHVNTNDTPNIRDNNGELIYNPVNWRAISPKQIKWLVDNAFNFTSKESNGLGWKIIIISHSPLEPTLDDNSDFPFYYTLSGVNRSENVANASLLRQIIRKLNAGITGSLSSYYTTVPTTTYGTYKKITSTGFVDVDCSVEMHNLNKKYFGTTYTIDGLENNFSVTMPQGVVIPVIACISGHTHSDKYYSLDNKTHHITLSGIANSLEDDEPDVNEFAITIMMIKNDELFFFRQGRGMGTVSNPILINGSTNYGISNFKDNKFTF